MSDLLTPPPILGTDQDLLDRLRVVDHVAMTDELMVAGALVVAGVSAPPKGEVDQTWASTAVAAAGEAGAVLYDLWYRLKVHHNAMVPFDRWYWLARAFGATEAAGGPALRLFARLLELETVEERQAACGVRPDAPPLATYVPDDARAFVAGVSQGRAPAAVDHRRWRGLLGPSQVRAEWEAMRDEDRVVLLLEFADRIEALEQVRFWVNERVIDNRGVTHMLQSCHTRPVADWDLEHLTLATLVWMWRESGIVLQEFNQTPLLLPLIAEFFVRRAEDYCAVLGEISPVSWPLGPLHLARLLGALRVRVERGNHRCIQFDGANWERREFLVPRQECDEAVPVPQALRERLRAAFGESGGDGPAYWAAVLDSAVAHGATPTDVVRELAHWSANTPDLPADYTIFTAPMGIKLDRPWELDVDDVFCFVGFNDEFDPTTAGVPFDKVGIWNAIGQRMRYNVVKKAQNYTLVKRFKPQSFNLPDIAVAEDANHAGHHAAGIRLSCRIPTHVHHHGTRWKGLADVRLNRVEYRRENEFRPSDVPLAMRYAVWLGWFADAVYARGMLFDETYCRKLVRDEHPTLSGAA